MEQTKTRTRIPLRVHPGAKKTALAEKSGGVYRVLLAAPPIDGRANEELICFFAILFHIPRSAVRIVRGLAGRMKLVEIDGIDAAMVERILNNEH